MDKTVNVGLIGLGSMGVKHFGIYQKLPDVKVVAIVDADLSKSNGNISKVRLNGQIIADNYVDLSKIKFFTDVQELIANTPELDMIDICLPTSLHPLMIKAGVKANLPVFCEKPLCLDLYEAESIIELIRNSGIYFNLGLCVRLSHAYLHAKNFISSGAAGKIQSAIFRRNAPKLTGWFVSEQKTGGALLDLHIHDTDIVNYLFGCPDAVSSFGAKDLVSQESGFDQLNTVYHYNNGPFVTAECTWAAAPGMPFQRSFLIIGEKATLQLSSTGYCIYFSDGSMKTPDLEEPDLPDGWHMELKYFTDCVRDKHYPDKYQTIDDLLVTYQILRSEKESIINEKKIEIK
jgi:predicted dehydrogenase